MPWWFGPSIVGVIVVGICAGLLVSFIIIKRQNGSLQSPFKHNHQTIEPSATQPYDPIKESVGIYNTDRRVSPAVEENLKSSLSEQDKVEEYLNQRKKNNSTSSVATPQKCDALAELENNLAIATRPFAGKLENFQTNIWNTRRSDFNPLNPETLEELTEAYVDMLLANNIVWLVTELGRDSKDLNTSYTGLSNKVGERLQRLMPALRDSLK
jgi:MFS superfamily sulfate permease-like transporter